MKSHEVSSCRYVRKDERRRASGHSLHLKLLSYIVNPDMLVLY